MRMKVKIKMLTITTLALIGAGKVCCWAVDGMAWVLVHFGEWDPAEAASVAPELLLVMAAGLAFSLYGMHLENQQYKHSSPYGSVDCSTCHQEQKKSEERGA